MATLAFISEPAGSEKFRTTGKFHCPFPGFWLLFFLAVCFGRAAGKWPIIEIIENFGTVRI